MSDTLSGTSSNDTLSDVVSVEAEDDVVTWLQQSGCLTSYVPFVPSLVPPRQVDLSHVMTFWRWLGWLQYLP